MSADEKQTPLVITALLTKVGVNYGDHGQDDVIALDVCESMTVGELVRSRLLETRWDRTPEPGGKNFITLRLAEPARPIEDSADLEEGSRCPRCGSVGSHGLVHVRHGNGGGHNERCPWAPEEEPS